MFNIPVTTKLVTAVRLKDPARACSLLNAYDFFVSPTSCSVRVFEPVAQLEYHETLIALYLSRRFKTHYFIEISSNPNLKSRTRRLRTVVFTGPQAQEAVRAFKECKDFVEERFKRRYFISKIRGASGESYRKGLLEATLDRTPATPWDSDTYNSILDGVRLRGSIHRGRGRDLRDSRAWGIGLDDGLLHDFPV